MTSVNRVVLTMGTFDILHSGHLSLFKQCRKIAGESGIVIATVNSDEFVEKHKGHPAAQNEEDRRAIVEALEFVDEVDILYSDHDAVVMMEQLLEGYRYDSDLFVVVGSDWAPPVDYYGRLGASPEWFDEWGVSLVYVPRKPNYSSTAIKGRVRGSV